LYKKGEFVGLGYNNRRNFDDEVVISLVIPDSPAADAGLQRGDVIRAIGGLQIATLDAEDRWGEVTGENVPGVSVDLTLARDGVERDVTLTKDWIELQTVPDDDIFEIDGRKVGYLLFASFLDPAHDALDDAFHRFANAGVRELVLDMRYNGGGLLDVARHLISLVVDRKGGVAYRVVYNDNYSGEDHDVQMTSHAGTLSEVDHVVVITTGSTLSASELVINALRPYVKVSIVGDTTGGKPVGSRHLDFCDKMLAALTFKLLNATGEGEYFDGFAADCPAVDDFAHELGDPAEASLAAAFALVRGEACPELPEPAEVHAGPDARLRVTPPAPTPQRDDLPDEFPGLF
jgi:C-terminal peptidase prc